jgi:hypothetical protein
MAVIINIKGNKETDEYKDALVLKEIFEKGIPHNINGRILIISNATLFGQETKDVDLIAIGSFEKYSLHLRTRSKSRDIETNQDVIDNEIKERQIFISDFCFVFECKKHRAEDVQLNGLNLLVRYGKKLSDVTHQSEKQKFSLKSFFEERLNFSPLIANFIWLRNVSWQSIKSMVCNDNDVFTSHNYLPNAFSVSFIFQLACIQWLPFTSFDKEKSKLKNYSSYNSLRKGEKIDFQRISDVFDLFEKVKDGMGQLTRKKVEHITKNFLDNQQYAQAIGKKLVIISGKAGTGKTIRLLKIACDIAINNGARCLILTYNLALVSDIKRCLALADIPDGIDDYSVNITTLHKFMYELFFSLGIGVITEQFDNGKTATYVKDFLSNYAEYLKELMEYFKEGIIDDTDIKNAIKRNHDAVSWDYILIDEAQDWGEDEKKILFSIFGKEKLIIADGIDQLIRTQTKCNWTRGFKPDIDFHKTYGKKGLRQKVNLVAFVNKVAEKLNINWEVEPKEELIGGRIIISSSGYDQELHEQLYNECISKGNLAYEMMFLVPPSLVERNGKKRHFNGTESFNQMKIHLWDGTDTDLRTEYPIELNQHRLLQYESCRGLEGWTVVCLDFDQFIKYKMETYEEENVNELALESFEEKRDRFVYLWSLIPLTRAIDTLVLTIKDKDSRIHGILREIYEENPDFIQWIE